MLIGVIGHTATVSGWMRGGGMEEDVTLVLVEVCSALMGAIVAVAMGKREE